MLAKILKAAGWFGYIPNCENASRRFQQGEGPNRGLLQALLPSVDSLTALVTMMVQVTHVENEKRILAAVSHPFIVRLVSAGLDTRFSAANRLIGCTIMEKAPSRSSPPVPYDFCVCVPISRLLTYRLA